MRFNRFLFLLLLIVSCIRNPVYAVEKPIGYWNSFLPYNTAVNVATDGIIVYVATAQAFFTINKSANYHIESYSKVNGMSDVGMKCIGFDKATSYCVLGYANGNIDLFKNNTFYNIPDFKLKSITGSKDLNNLFVENGLAFFSTSVGVLVVDLTKQYISETYQFIVNNQLIAVNSFVSYGDKYYAATQNGLYSADKSRADLQNFQVWTHVDSTDTFFNLAVVNGNLYGSSQNAIFQLVGGSMLNIHTCTLPITHIDGGINNLFVCQANVTNNGTNGCLLRMDASNNVTDSISFADKPYNVVQTLDSTIYVANLTGGMQVWSLHQLFTYVPDGPSSINSFNLYSYNGSLWIAHGGYDDSYRPNRSVSGFSNFNKDKWNVYKNWVYAPLWDSLTDFVSIVRDESSGIVYSGAFGSYYQGGVFALHDDGSYQIFKQNSLDRGVITGGWQVAGMTLDNSNNLWVTMFSSPHELNVLEKSSGKWYNYRVNVARNPANLGGPIVIDDYGQVWYVNLWGTGVMVYNTNATLDNISDDTYYHFSTGVGTGNLPSNTVYCITKDKSNNIWIGSSNGIGIVYQSGTCIQDKCDATIPIVQYDQYAGYLFAGQNVRAISVDGADRKWVGTDNGVWLLTPDASQIVYHFTQDNSPLPSNHIQSIAVDKVTGDVYFGTDQGLVSYRSTATEPGDTNHNVNIFPNPVPSGYTGTIAINGLVGNADVRITDIDGQLVFRTTAFGGQAIWNGMDYKGHRPQSGVYLVFVTNTDNSQSGTQTHVGKIVFIQ